MQLEKISIRNYRSIKEEELSFQQNFQILVGINEAGKSNILNACSLLDQDSKTTLDDIRESTHDEEPPDEAYVRFYFRLSINDCYQLNKGFLKTHALTLNPRAPIVTESGKHHSLESIISRRNNFVHTVDLINNSRHNQQWRASEQFTIHRNWRKVRAGANHPVKGPTGNINISTMKIVNVNDIKGIPEKMLEDLTPKHFNTIIREFIGSEMAKKIPTLIKWNYNEESLLPGRVVLSGFISNPNICLPLKNMFLLSGYDEITKALTDAKNKKNGIRNLLRRVGEKTSQHMKAVWPEWKKYHVDLIQNGDAIEAGIQDEYNTYSLDRRSDGFKRFFTFLLMISAKNKAAEIKDNILIIDEPDTGLHPSGIQHLAKELKLIGENNLVLTSTHSIFMIDKTEIGRHLIVNRDKEVTKISRVTVSNMQDEEVIFKALGYSLFELLKPINVIFEGWRDKHLFEMFMRSARGKALLKDVDLNQVGLLHAVGVKDIQRVANTCENFGRKYIALSDSDAPAKQFQRAFSGHGDWVCYDDIEGINADTTEDFVDTKAINRCAKAAMDQLFFSGSVEVGPEADTKKLDSLALSLRKTSLDKNQVKAVLNETKDQIAHATKAVNLNDDYDRVVTFVGDKIKSLQGESS